MLRFLFDPLGDPHEDLVLKVDGLPGMAKVVDSYYFSDFLGDKEEDGPVDVRRQVVLRYIDFVTDQISSINDQVRFIPVDLSDQYVGGLLINRGRKDLLNVKYVWSDALAGHAIDRAQAYAGIGWKEEGKWELSREAVLEGLSWSKRTISAGQE